MSHAGIPQRDQHLAHMEEISHQEVPATGNALQSLKVFSFINFNNCIITYFRFKIWYSFKKQFSSNLDKIVEKLLKAFIHTTNLFCDRQRITEQLAEYGHVLCDIYHISFLCIYDSTLLLQLTSLSF